MAFALPLALLTVALDVVGDVQCPTPGQVKARLVPLLAGELGPGERVQLERADGVLRVSLVREDGRVRGVRNVDDRHDCGELAEAAAIIVASWEGAPDGALAAELPPVPAPARLRLAAGLGVGANLAASAEGAFAPALALAANLRGRAGLGLSLRAGFGGRHRQVVAATAEPRQGELLWRRVPIALGPSWTWRNEDGGLSADLSAAAAWLSVAGAGFSANQHHDALDLGASAGLRLEARRRLRPWLGLATTFWPRPTVAAVRADAARVALPRFELLAVVGIGWEGGGDENR